MSNDRRRRVPSVDALLRSEPARRASETLGRPVVKQAVTEVLTAARARAERGRDPGEAEQLLTEAVALAGRITGGLTPVINATGVILHTNLGRAPLAPAARRAVTRAADSYADVEVDRHAGKRGTRTARATALLTAITGAEAALVVNNCAAALLLALAALAKGRTVLVSRGELIEIGGEFRIPEIVAASGARLVEVGTTNRTRAADYRAALQDRTAAILKVHTSNYRVVGFTGEAAAADLATIAAKAGIPFVYDVGSGLLERERGLPADEPSVREALAAGADLVTCSGDKLLGGPQAGLVLGRSHLVAKLAKHPIARAVRVDKLQLAALEATLVLHATGRHAEVPTHAMLHASADAVATRAHLVAEAIGGDLEGAHVVKTVSVVGGGSMPGLELPSWGVRVRVPDAAAFAGRLRAGRPAVFARTADDHVLLDVRTVTDAQVPHLARAVQYALEGDDHSDDEDPR
jgi:L-seryl-tRNA(Ser) seleniumtransferase